MGLVLGLFWLAYDDLRRLPKWLLPALAVLVLAMWKFKWLLLAVPVRGRGGLAPISSRAAWSQSVQRSVEARRYGGYFRKDKPPLAATRSGGRRRRSSTRVRTSLLITADTGQAHVVALGAAADEFFHVGQNLVAQRPHIGHPAANLFGQSLQSIQFDCPRSSPR